MTEKTLSPLAKQLQEEWSLSHIFTRKVDDALKQAQAKVLAACIKAADEHNSFNHDDGSPCSGYCGEIIASKIRSLQPAASELKELLRKAELKGRLDEYRDVHGNSLLGGPCCTMECRGCEHIRELERELEKARASEEKS